MKRIRESIQSGDVDAFKDSLASYTKYRSVERITRYAISSGNLEMLKCAHESGCTWKNNIILLAVEVGNIDILRYIREEMIDPDCIEWDNVWLCNKAAEHGNLECLKYLRYIGCPWYEGACSYAAIGGQLECLKYLRENGCPWSSCIAKNAHANGHMDCYEYAVDPW